MSKRAGGVERPVGRPRCSPIDLLNAVDFIRKGRTKQDAARLAGVSYTSLWRYLQAHPDVSLEE